MSFQPALPSPESRARLREMMAPVPTEPICALPCAAGSVLAVAYHEYRECLDRLLSHIRSYDERVHGALQVDLRDDYEERWRQYQSRAMEHASAAEKYQEDADYASELVLRNTLISKRRDDIVIFAASFDRAIAYNPDGWFEELDHLIAEAQAEWDEMVEMRCVYAEDDE